MNVAHIVSGFDSGGIETLVLHLLPIFQNEGISNTLISLSSEKGDAESEFRETGAEIIKVDKSGTIDISTYLSLKSLFDNRSFDVIHTHNRSTVVRAAAGLTETPLVVTYQNFYNPNIRTSSLTRRLLMKAENKLRFFDDVSVSVSKYVHNTHFHGAPLRDDRKVIYNAVNVNTISSIKNRTDPDDVRHELGINTDSLVIGNVGRLADQKGQEYLLSAVQDVVKRWPNIRLIVVGDGPKREHLEKRSEKLGISSFVHFLGSRRDVYRLLTAMDIFAFPSLWEGFPLALLEAMSAELPIVATDIGPHPEMIESGTHGFLVEPENPFQLASKIEHFLESSSRRQTFGQNAKRRVQKNFTIQKTAKNYLSTYKSISR